MPFSKHLFVLVAFSFTLTGCGGPTAGIVSLHPAITETLFALDLGNQVIAVSTDCDYPVLVRALPRVGTRYQPDVDAIQLLSPQKIFSSESGNGLSEFCMEKGISYYTLSMNSLEELDSNIEFIGAITGTAGKASALIQQIHTELDAVRERVADKTPTKVLLVTDRKGDGLEGIVAAGGGSLLGELATIAGCENVFGTDQRQALEVSQEDIRTAAPDAILEIRAGTSLTQNQRQKVYNAWKRLDGVPATENGRIYIMTESHALRPGPRVAEIANAIADTVYGEIVAP